MIAQHRWFLHSVLLFAALVVAATAQAAPPLGTAFTYQGQLKQSGSPVNGTVNLDFTLWNDPAATDPGNQIGSTQSIAVVSVTNGVFTVSLNAGGEFGANAFNGEARWLEIAVNGTTLSPRQELTATPHAHFALNADRLDGLDSTAFLQSVPVPLTLSGTSATHIIRGENASTTDYASGVYGIATAISGDTFGGEFISMSESGIGVAGEATAQDGPTYGVYGVSNSTSGTGVFGAAYPFTGTTYGVYGVSNSASGTGVYGFVGQPAGTTYGVYGKSASNAGIGVYGIASFPSGTTYGGDFENNSTDGRGVRGAASAVTGQAIGGRFSSASTSGRGVWSTANAATGTTYGVYGESNSPSGYDFYAAGVGLNYGAASSRRWKRNIEPIGQPLDKLGRLRGVYFKWDAEHGGRHDVGMIAEEVGAVLPEIVNYEENGVDAVGMDYSKMTPLLVEAVNALRVEKDRQIAERDRELAEQRKKIDDLTARLERLERLVADPDRIEPVKTEGAQARLEARR